eukprot:TRINITY_DN3884_c0_g1_i16.p3 TRINITY_DN3884_c0_g1~~TRINITY_DN3884_c0_g1_i16.p3  ORF type:complete len:343 (+),score=33.67 TRINITY_DN3884_c0_g1_i16:2205-3233(+)
MISISYWGSSKIQQQNFLQIQPNKIVFVFVMTDAGPSSDVRNNQTDTSGPTQRKNTQGTQEQRQMVQQILKKKDYYEILGINKNAKDEDIKKAYRKLALKLHPDKCQIQGAEEAFKLVSKSFACLSDPDKRAFYDRTGFENSNAAAASRGADGMGGVYNMDDIDPQELFNQMFGSMFFGTGMFPSTHFRVYRNGRMYTAQGPRRQPQQRQQPMTPEEQRRDQIYKLLQILPILLLLVFTFLGDFRQEAVYSLRQSRNYSEKLSTEKRSIPFYVRNTDNFNKEYPVNSNSRRTVERQVEMYYKDNLENRCYQEQVREMQSMYTFGKKQKFPKPSCDELKEKFY